MLVYKFGGASIATPDRMRALVPIVEDVTPPLMLIVSALGKTTNALEEIVKMACKDKKDEAHKLAKELEDTHLEYAKEILNDEQYEEAVKALNVFFTELQWSIDDADANKKDFSYDQIVCIGEMLSTRIMYYFLKQEGYKIAWVDVRDIIRTDNVYRDAKVDYEYSRKQAQEKIKSLLEEGYYVISQGFIGATDENNSTTLGREGSDYSAALMASMLDADSVTIWKDVEGLKNADPRQFEDTVKIEAISYHEIIEMAYFGAQVVHPKTIQPLHSKNIPLYIRCFLNKDAKGTIVTSEVSNLFYPPLIVLKKNQVLIQVTAKDYSFITEDKLSDLYNIFHRMNVRVNLIQNEAISFVACIDHKEGRLKELLNVLSQNYKVFDNEDVSLLTLRHYTPEIFANLTKGKHILLEQKTRETIQVVLK